MNKYLNFPIIYFIIIYISLYIIFTYFSHYILLSDELYYATFKDIVGLDNMSNIIKQQKIIQKIGYAFLPIIILIRISYTSICLLTGTFLSEIKLTFKECFNIATKSDVIFLLALIIKINYHSIIGITSLTDINQSLFSLLHLLDFEIEPWAIYPFSVINIFEILYWCIISYFIMHYTKLKFTECLLYLFSTYGLGLIIWTILITYINVLLSF